jgi:uncharacterized protein YciI
LSLTDLSHWSPVVFPPDGRVVFAQTEHDRRRPVAAGGVRDTAADRVPAGPRGRRRAAGRSRSDARGRRDRGDTVWDVVNLFVLDLTYRADLAEIDRLMDAHRAFLRGNYEAGVFLASGRKEPRTGGVILAAGDRATIEKIVESDPFSVHGVAAYTITEFIPTTTGPELAAYRLPV